MADAVLRERPHAGSPHVRAGGQEGESGTPRRGSPRGGARASGRRIARGLALSLACAAGVVRADGDVRIAAAQAEVVVAPDAPKTVLFAADEMTNVLSQAFGRVVPLVSSPTPGKAGVYLGDGDWTRRAGIDVATLKRDAFTISAKDGNVYIAGRDDPSADLGAFVRTFRGGAWDMFHEHATLFGVYEFLERFAGCRFYFPGELGTIVPRRDEIVVPVGALTVVPHCLERNYKWYGDGVYFEGDDRAHPLLPMRKLNYVRNRMQTLYIPCNHGSDRFYIAERFGKTHPEYLCLFKPDGKTLVRDIDLTQDPKHAGQLCHSSAVYDELYKDILSYARGEDPSVRGVASRGRPQWNHGTFRRPWVDIMPQDGMRPCLCDKCQAAYTKGDFHYATELVWGRTVELANRIKAAGLDLRITQMAYTPYGRPPAFDIPDNVDVMVAAGGPWTVGNERKMAAQLDAIRSWSEKLGRPVWLWTYPCKYGTLEIPHIPNGTPRAWGKFFKAVAPWSFGAYAECENDRAFYNTLSYYVFGKVLWDPKTDVEALLDEYFRLMFGRAAPEMAQLVEEVERLWISGVASQEIDTADGPVHVVPSQYDLYVKIYSADRMKAWSDLFARAEARVPRGSLEARRIALYRREILDPVVRAGEAYRRKISVAQEVANRREHPNRRNLLVNGDFTQTPNLARGLFGVFGQDGSFRGGWITDLANVPHVSFHDDVPEGVKGRAMKLTGSGEDLAVVNSFVGMNGRFKPGVRYRISYFARLTDVVPVEKDGSACVSVVSDLKHAEYFPKGCQKGTTDWIHQEFFHTAGPNTQEVHSSFRLFLKHCTGSVEYADVRVEEAGAEAR